MFKLLFWVGRNAFHLNLLTPNSVVYCLNAIGAGLADDDLFSNVRGFGDDGLF